jgi:hypothetical protein
VLPSPGPTGLLIPCIVVFVRWGEDFLPCLTSTVCFNVLISFSRSARLGPDTPTTVIVRSESALLVGDIPNIHDTTDAPVGLSDPQYVGQKRRMMDSVNRLRATG